MVKKIMDLYLLLYSLAGLGVLGAAGMLATNLSYRRIIRKTMSARSKVPRNILCAAS